MILVVERRKLGFKLKSWAGPDRAMQQSPDASYHSLHLSTWRGNGDIEHQQWQKVMAFLLTNQHHVLNKHDTSGF